MAVTKDDLRARCRQHRAEMSAAERQVASSRIERRVLELVHATNAAVIHVYWPIETNLEIDTRPIVHSLVEMGRVVVIPAEALSSFDAMVQRRFTTDDELVENKWGTFEPASGELVGLRETDLVIAPSLAADKNGFRLGYGGGYYDRFLAKANCVTATVVYSDCLFEQIPREPHDVRLHYVLTEHDTIVTEAPAT